MVKGRVLTGCNISREVSFEVRVAGDISIDHISKMIDMLKTQQFILAEKKETRPKLALEKFIEKEKVVAELNTKSLPTLHSLKKLEDKAMNEVWDSIVLSAEDAMEGKSGQIPSASTHVVVYINEKLKYLQKRNRELLKKVMSR